MFYIPDTVGGPACGAPGLPCPKGAPPPNPPTPPPALRRCRNCPSIFCQSNAPEGLGGAPIEPPTWPPCGRSMAPNLLRGKCGKAFCGGCCFWVFPVGSLGFAV